MAGGPSTCSIPAASPSSWKLRSAGRAAGTRFAHYACWIGMCLDRQIHLPANDPVMIDIGRAVDQEAVIFGVVARDLRLIAGKSLDGLHRVPPAQRGDF